MKPLVLRRACVLLVVFASACSGPAPAATSSPTARAEHVNPTHTPRAETPTSTATPPSHSTIVVPPTLSPSEPVLISVDASVRYQTMDGFGATHISLTYQGAGDVLGSALRAKAIEAIYGRVGLNLGNLEGALLESPGGYDQRSNDNSDPNDFNWSGFQTFSADAIRSNLLAFAEPLGFNGYYIDQRVNVRWASPWLSEIRGSDYDRYVEEASEQIAAGIIYWRDQYGIVPRYIMPFNEPLSGNGELQSGNTQEVVDLVKAIGARLVKEGFTDVRFVLPNEETVDRTLEVATAILSDPEARRYAGPIGYHSYPYGSAYASIPNILSASGAGVPDANAVAVRNKLAQLSQQYALPVWMTEVSHGGVDPLSYDAFRGRAIHIHDELVYANASAYFGMNNMWDTTSQQLHFGDKNLFDYSNEGNIVLIDDDEQKVYITGMGYAIGHYARWVKSGSVRVEAVSEDPLVQVTAFISPDSSRIILVLINNNIFPREINVSLKSAEFAGGVSGEQSTPDQYWNPVTEVEKTSPDGFVVTLPAESVTTYMFPLVP